MRIRTVKPEFWSHPVLARMSAESQLLAIGLLNYADDEGYFQADFVLIRNALRPFDKGINIIEKTITELAKKEYLVIKKHPEYGSVGLICNFKKHQVINRPNQSRIKSYFISEHSVITHGVLTDDSWTEGKGIGREEEGKGKSEAVAFRESWSQLPAPFKQPRAWTDSRNASLRERLKNPFWRENWRSGLERIQKSKFCRGENDRQWTVDVDFFLRPDSLAKILEGKYDDKGKPPDLLERKYADDLTPEQLAEIYKDENRRPESSEGEQAKAAG